MPEIRHYTVRQVREIKVWANDPLGAAKVADATFRGQDALDVGAPTSDIRVVDLNVVEDRPKLREGAE